MEGLGDLGWGASVSVENARSESLYDESERVEPFPVLEECSRSRVALK